MSPACKEHLEMLDRYFDGDVYVVQDLGDQVFVLIDPLNRGPFIGECDPGDAWKRIDKPTIVLIAPKRKDYPRLVS
jgi:hypothetical protein